jgi:hypothetical protein
MTAPIDLEGLRAVLSVLKYEAGTIPFDSRDYGPQREQDVADIEDAHRAVQLALAELTTRRARDAEVAALVAAAKRANGDHSAPHDCYATGPLTGDDYLDLVSCPGCELIAALKPFTRATP